jgi:hypothetical protein
MIEWLKTEQKTQCLEYGVLQSNFWGSERWGKMKKKTLV